MAKLDWSPVLAKLAKETRRAVATFRRDHPDEVVTQVAIDATPDDDFFGVCFDTGSAKEVGNYAYPLFHELSAGIALVEPDLAVGDRVFAPLLKRVLGELADAGAFRKLATGPTLRVGYCFHDSVFVPVRTLKIAKPVKAKPAKAAKAIHGAPPGELPWLVNGEDAEKLLAKDWPHAFDAATPYFASKLERDRDGAREILGVITERIDRGKREDSRWEQRAIGELRSDDLDNQAIGLLRVLGTKTALAALRASMKQEPRSSVAHALAEHGDSTGVPFLCKRILDPKCSNVGWAVGAIEKAGDPVAIPALEQFLAKRKRHPDRDYVAKVLARLRT